jgi:hypothetical protein
MLATWHAALIASVVADSFLGCAAFLVCFFGIYLDGSIELLLAGAGASVE